MLTVRPYLLAFLITGIFLGCSDEVVTQTALPTGTSTLFSGSGNCILCHKSDGVANTTSGGEDVSQPENWRATMMANSAKDPLWQAMVRAESEQLPALAGVIQDRCTNCHIPMGHEEAHRAGASEYTLDEGKIDGLAMDGVSCTVCHQILPDNLGTRESFSGGYEISDARVTFGPYQNPVKNPMVPISGFEPLYSPHVNTSELCATCHTLFTPYVDDNNQVVGEFAEQTPYLEWKNSAYPAENTHCQTCHMPVTSGNAFKISALGQVSPREPFFQHYFVGGNAFMLDIMKVHGAELGITADAVHFDTTIARTLRQLTTQTVRLSADASLSGTTLGIAVRVENLAGHKFPSGFPARRAWLHVTVRNANGAIVFESGKPDGGDLHISGEYESHHDQISGASQVQVYESVMEDVSGNVTHQLLRGAKYAKDNRLPPRGFTAEAMMNDTVGVYGNAASDPDFNRDNGVAGSGADIVHYSIAVDENGGPYSAEVEMLYQTVNPEFIEHMFEYDGDEIERFEEYFEDADNTPVVVSSLELESIPTGMDNMQSASLFSLKQNYPNPVSLSRDGTAKISCVLQRTSRHLFVEILNVFGSVVRSSDKGERYAGEHEFVLSTEHLAPGMYFYRVRGDGFSAVRKMVVTL